VKTIAWRPALEAFLDACEKIKRGHRILIFAGSFLLLGGGFFYFVWLPITGEIHQTEKEITDLKQKIHLAKIRAKQLADFKEKEAQLDKEFLKAVKLLPHKREIPTLLADVSQLGVNSKLQFRLFSPGKETLKDFYVEIPVSIEVSGRYRDLALFFDKVRKMARIVNIVNISIGPKEELSTDLITKCEAITYRFKTEADEQKEKMEKAQKNQKTK
jgi:type IV pilus assembly protein PilO